MLIHVNPETGATGKCRAQSKECPFGAEAHFDNQADAQQYAEQIMEAQYSTTATVQKTEPVLEDFEKYMQKLYTGNITKEERKAAIERRDKSRKMMQRDGHPPFGEGTALQLNHEFGYGSVPEGYKPDISEIVADYADQYNMIHYGETGTVKNPEDIHSDIVAEIDEHERLHGKTRETWNMLGYEYTVEEYRSLVDERETRRAGVPERPPLPESTPEELQRVITDQELREEEHRLSVNAEHEITTPWEEREAAIREELQRLSHEVRNPSSVDATYLKKPIAPGPVRLGFSRDSGTSMGLYIEDSAGEIHQVQEDTKARDYPALSQHIFHHPEASEELADLIRTDRDIPVEWRAPVAEITNRDEQLDPEKQQVEMHGAYKKAADEREKKMWEEHYNNPVIQSGYYD